MTKKAKSAGGKAPPAAPASHSAGASSGASLPKKNSTANAPRASTAAAAADGTPAATCRICYGDAADGRLMSPCHCKGSMKYVHDSCLNSWRLRSEGNDAYHRCDHCKFGYRGRRKVELVHRAYFALVFLAVLSTVQLCAVLSSLVLPSRACTQATMPAMRKWSVETVPFLPAPFLERINRLEWVEVGPTLDDDGGGGGGGGGGKKKKKKGGKKNKNKKKNKKGTKDTSGKHEDDDGGGRGWLASWSSTISDNNRRCEAVEWSYFPALVYGWVKVSQTCFVLYAIFLPLYSMTVHNLMGGLAIWLLEFGQHVLGLTEDIGEDWTEFLHERLLPMAWTSLMYLTASQGYLPSCMIGVPLNKEERLPFLVVALCGFACAHHMVHAIVQLLAELLGVPRRIMIGERWVLLDVDADGEEGQLIGEYSGFQDDGYDDDNFDGDDHANAGGDHEHAE